MKLQWHCHNSWYSWILKSTGLILQSDFSYNQLECLSEDHIAWRQNSCGRTLLTSYEDEDESTGMMHQAPPCIKALQI